MRKLLAFTLGTAASVASAQQEGAPLSAIDWLSESVETMGLAQPLPLEPPPASAIAVSPIEVTPLDAPSADSVGLLSSAQSGLPRTLWASSDPATLSRLVTAQPVETLPAMQGLLQTLLLAEADPPLGSGPNARFFLARVDKLLDIGALEPAQALLDGVPEPDPRTFRRLFDVVLLNGTEDDACRILLETPDLAPTIEARVFCLARSGDWPAAALTLNGGRAIGDLTAEEDELLARFLDPEMAEIGDPLPRPARPTPLTFRLYEAIGEALDTTDLPRAFVAADLRATNGWRPQLAAAERLIQAGAIPPNRFFGTYQSRRPAASGGVWDRVAAFQAFEAALKDGEVGHIAEALPAAWDAMGEIGASFAFARQYSAALADIEMTNRAQKVAGEVALLGTDYELAVRPGGAAAAADPFLQAIARGRLLDVNIPTDPLARAIADAFSGSAAPAELTQLADAGKLGEALLHTISLMEDGRTGDPQKVTDALATLLYVGLEDVARQSALQLLILRQPV